MPFFHLPTWRRTAKVTIAMVLGLFLVGSAGELVGCVPEDSGRPNDSDASATDLDGAARGDGGAAFDGSWSATPHFIVVGTRGETPMDVRETDTSAQLRCSLDRGTPMRRPEVDVTAIGDLADGIGEVRLKLKDYDVPAGTVGEEVTNFAGIRIEWELKEPSGATLCEQNATEGRFRFEAVPRTSGEIFGGTFEATLGEGDGCPVAHVVGSFTVPCEIADAGQ